MPRKALYFDEVTQERLDALAPLYQGNESEAVRVAVASLWRLHFQPASEAPDEVLECAGRHLRLALATIEGELEQRSNTRERQEPPETAPKPAPAPS